MHIVDFERYGGFAADGKVLARFSIQVTPDLRLCGLKLVETPKGRRTFFPSVSGGGRSTTASPALARQITETASKFLEGHTHANSAERAA